MKKKNEKGLVLLVRKPSIYFLDRATKHINPEHINPEVYVYILRPILVVGVCMAILHQCGWGIIATILVGVLYGWAASVDEESWWMTICFSGVNVIFLATARWALINWLGLGIVAANIVFAVSAFFTLVVGTVFVLTLWSRTPCEEGL